MGETDHTADISSTDPTAVVPENAGEQAATTPVKTADRPHNITITLGLLSPLLALISVGVSLYVFRDSQRSMRVAQRAYLGFHFESAEVAPETVGNMSGAQRFRVKAKVSVRDIGNTPAYIDLVKQELYAIEGDDMWDHIGGSNQVSPNFDALSPRGDPLSVEFNSAFTDQDFRGDRSVVYRAEIQWHDAFGEVQTPTVFCAILRDFASPIREKRPLTAETCIRGMTVSIGSAR